MPNGFSKHSKNDQLDSDRKRWLRRKQLHRILQRLQDHYEFDNLGNLPDPLDELIYIVLSTRTQGSVFLQTFINLKRRFPNWSLLLEAPQEEVEEVLEPGGLSKKKASWLKLLLREIVAREGSANLDGTRSMSDEEVEDYLTSLPGVGLKTARCVMMYSLSRQALPVDANVQRIFERLGLMERDIHYSKIHDVAQAIVPEDLRALLHIYCVIHGRKKCTPRNPRCTACPLLAYCDFGARRIEFLANAG